MLHQELGRFEEGQEKRIFPREYGLILLRRLQRVKQGSKSVQAYYEELYSSLHRANVVDDINAMTYFKRGLNPNIAAAIEVKYFRSTRGLLNCAIKEEKKIMKVQQDCINL